MAAAPPSSFDQSGIGVACSALSRRRCATPGSVFRAATSCRSLSSSRFLDGEILVRRHDRLRALDAEHPFPFALGTGFVQLVAWWTNARRFAVGMRGPRWFLPSAEWSPPLGWWPWLVLAIVGVCLLIASPLLDRFLSGRPTEIGRLGPP